MFKLDGQTDLLEVKGGRQLELTWLVFGSGIGLGVGGETLIRDIKYSNKSFSLSLKSWKV